MGRNVFISHKNTPTSNAVGKRIFDALQDDNHNVFFDKTFLEGGMNWKTSIWDNLIYSDVVILVLDDETSDSDWVQREVDIARALKISILPVVVGYSVSKVRKSMERFDLQDIQAVPYKNTDEKEIKKSIDEIRSLIETLSANTSDQQLVFYKRGLERRRTNKSEKTRAEKNPNRFVYKHPKHDNLHFHIASGDASQMTEFDILVNSENNTMQMARFFEGSTLSYSIRSAGALIEDGAILVEDTIQDELYRNALAKGGLPVSDARVLATSAGHKRSKMRRFTDYRYTFHVASVRVNLKNRRVQAIGDIDSLILNCIEKIKVINDNLGAIELDDDEFLVKASADYAPLTSILFPLFGSGHGGEDVEKVAKEMITCFAIDVPDHIKNLGLGVTKIGLSAYCEQDVTILRDLFNNNFELISQD